MALFSAGSWHIVWCAEDSAWRLLNTGHVFVVSVHIVVFSLHSSQNAASRKTQSSSPSRIGLQSHSLDRAAQRCAAVSRLSFRMASMFLNPSTLGSLAEWTGHMKGRQCPKAEVRQARNTAIGSDQHSVAGTRSLGARDDGA